MKLNPISKFLFILLFLIISLSSFGQLWEWSLGTGGSGDDRSLGLATDSAGNTYVTGHFTGSTVIGSTSLTSFGGDDIFIAKYNHVGTPQWAIQAGGTGYDRGYEMTTDNNGNAYLTGLYTGTSTFGSITIAGNSVHDIFITKISPSGIFQWVQTISGTDAQKGFDVDVDSIGNVYVSGDIRTQATFSSTVSITPVGNYDGFVAKYDNAGNFIWANSFGGNGKDKSQGVDVTPNGDIFVSGYFSLTADFAGVSKTSNGGFDACLVKYDTNGIQQWVKTGGSNSDDAGNSIHVDVFGNSYFGGFFTNTATFDTIVVQSNGDRDFFLIKYDSAGDIQWLNGGGGTGEDRIQCINIDDDGNIYCIGYYENSFTLGSTTLTSQGSTDCFLGKFFSSGNPIYIETAGGPGDDSGTSIDSDFNGNIYITGLFQNYAIFGTDTLLANGGDDVFVAKLTKVPEAMIIEGLLSYYCLDDTPDTLTGFPSFGTFSGAGIIGDVFYPSIAGPGTHIISYTEGGNTINQTINVSEVSNSIWLSDTSFCEGSFIMLSFNPDFNYSWSNGSTLSDLEVYTAEELYVDIIDSEGCTWIDTINISTYPLPQIDLGNDTSIMTGQSLLVDAGFGFDSYIWSTGETSQTITVVDQGLFIVTVTNSDGCENSDSIQVQITSSIESLSTFPFFVYPNPTNSYLNIEVNSTLSDFSIFDVLGNKCNMVQIKAENNTKYKLDLKLLNSGIYFIRLRISDKNYTQKIIKQ